ncbi:PREDICTED: uncharacterized protein LOC108753060 [Trachymyrmex septentrionalis]|uniref:uncharacterized protein LOC108753060 n=1 Tax=Trachymyrmex septentrionalis TaxID=34720 RepID=UPI00084EF950|nr:PREDICTED: uncharacterized protein LOC108753060 [Trachymyrmex septentrionalis]
MTETLERALAPLMTIGKFCNLGVFEYPVGQPRTCISYQYALAKWSLFIYFYHYPKYINEFQIDKTFNINSIVPLVTITLILISIYRFKELKMCLHELAIVDHTLEALGTPKEYQRLRNWIIRIIIGWIVYVFCQSIYLTFLLIFLKYDITLFWNLMLDTFLENYASDVIILSTMISATILGYIHLQLCLISRKLNKILKVQMLIQMVWYFKEALSFCLVMYKLFGEQHVRTFTYAIVYLDQYFEFVLRTILFLTLCCICQTIYNKISETVAILHKLSNYNLDEDLREQIWQFILQIKQREVKFGLGHYYYGYNFICWTYATILSVRIILTQVYNRLSILAMHEKFCLIMV